MATSLATSTTTEPEVSPPPLLRLLAYFLRLGATGFGGPIALASRMQRDLVEDRRWIPHSAYLDGLALSQLAPGPLAAQLAMYIGWFRGGIAGASLVGFAFVAPSFVMVLGLAALYLRHGGLPWMQDAFYGVAAVVIAIIARGALRLSRATLGSSPLLWTIAAVNAVSTVWSGRELLGVFLASGVLAIAARGAWPAVRHAPLRALAPWAPLASGWMGSAGGSLLLELGAFFTASGLVVFGSGLAIVPFLRGGVVEDHRWLTESQFLDAVAVAMITPGPVVITVAFIGFIVAGLAGAVVAAAAVFLPSLLLVIGLAPAYRRIAGHPTIAAFVLGVTSASCGALLGAVVVLGRRAILDLPALALAAGAWLLLWRFRALPEPLVIAAAALAGVLLRGG